ncbi:MAG: zinc-dependent metalloprotease [Bdellovibrionales bacterium]|nr:zinc-dependent metalloprotease [Bdellovibrionales bacterium]
MKKTNAVIFAGLFAALALGCTKNRPSKIADGPLRDNPPIAKTTLAHPVTVTTSSEVQTNDRFTKNSFQALGGQGNVKVIENNAASEIAFMFEELYLPVKPNQSYTITFDYKQSSKVLIANLETNNLSDLPDIFQKIAQPLQNSEGSETYRVPMFQYAVTHGNLVQSKNELEEKTNFLRFVAADDWKKAAYVQVAGGQTAQNREMANLPPSEQDRYSRIFSKDRINGLITNKEQLSKELGINLDIDAETKIYTLVEGDKLKFFKITKYPSEPLLTDAEKRVIQDGKATEAIRACTAESSQLIQLGEGEKCIHLFMYEVDISFVRPELTPVDEFGGNQARIRFVDTNSGKENDFFEIGRNPKPTMVRSGDRILQMDPRDYLQIDQFKDKTFLMRRMINNHTNSLPNIFIGSTGPIQIVRFRFKPNRIEIYRVDPTQQGPVNTQIDSEIIMSLPASYFIARKTDERGNPLPFFRMIETDSNSANFAKVDWKLNLVNDVGSPMDNLNGCFSRQSTTIESVDNRLEDNHVFNFSIEGLYAASPFAYCFGATGNTAMSNTWGRDANYVVKERVSFRLHDPNHDQFVSQNLPPLAQMAFGYRGLSHPQNRPRPNGVKGFVDTRVNPSLLHGFKNGTQTTYTIVGLPDNYRLRSEVIEATREVITDWNKNLLRAFKGTPLESKFTEQRPPLILQVNGENGVNVEVGDLDSNQLIFDTRTVDFSASGVFVPTPNPRSGLSEAGNVTIFLGNMEQDMGYHFWAAEMRKSYFDRIKELNEGGGAKVQYAMASGTNSNPAGGGPLREQGQPNLDGYYRPVESWNQFNEYLTSMIQLDDFSISPSSLRDSGIATIGTNGYWAAGFSPSLNLAANANLTQALIKNLNPYLNTLSTKDLEGFRASNVSDVLGDLTQRGSNLAQEAKDLWLQQALDATLKQSKEFGSSPRLMEANLLEKLLDARSEDFNSEELTSLSKRLIHLKLQMKYEKSLRNKTPSCFMDSPDLGDADLLQTNPDKALIASVKFTVAHELGHALGLDHNFLGSYDKANWEFEGENTGRTYSSIMEYTTMKQRLPDLGIGPQDVHAIRALYTGLVELDEKSISRISNHRITPEGSTKSLPVYGGKFVKVADVHTAFFPNKNWFQVDSQEIRQMPRFLRHYEYCTNGFEALDPNCNVHDMGSTSMEIVDHYITEHQANYELIAFQLNRVDFNIQRLIQNISAIEDTYANMRQFMDDALYRLFTQKGFGPFLGKKPEEWSPEDRKTVEAIVAAIKARNYLLSVVHAPDANPAEDMKSRIQPLVVTTKDENGNPKTITDIVDKKWLSGRSENDYGRFSQLGFYPDKALAMSFLTQRMETRPTSDDLAGNPAFSFMDFERIFLGINDIRNSPIAQTLAEVMMSDLSPKVYGYRSENFETIVSGEEANITNFMRTYGALNAVIGLNVGTTQPGFNYGEAFHVIASTRGAPASYDTVFSSEVPEGNPTDRRYYAAVGPKTTIANFIIHSGAELRKYMDPQDTHGSKKLWDEFVSQLVVKLQRDLDGKPTTDEQMAAIQKAVSDIFNNLKSMGFSEQESLEGLKISREYLTQLLKLFAPAMKKANSEEDLATLIKLSSVSKHLVTQVPVLLAANDALTRVLSDEKLRETLVKESVDVDSIKKSLPNISLKDRYEDIRSNLDLLNRFYSNIEPSARNF